MKEITLTRGKVALVDDADYERVAQYKWYAVHPSSNPAHTWYAARSSRDKPRGKKRMMYLHRFLMDAISGDEVDHADRNGLNCSRANLRKCTHSENAANAKRMSTNTSGYRGVYWNKEVGCWYAQVVKDKRRSYMGCFRDIEAAARAYDKKAIELFGEFARTNF
jgi:hypothetical protein